jgi:diguanylate cyclase (GGDEF)-like protein
MSSRHRAVVATLYRWTPRRGELSRYSDHSWEEIFTRLGQADNLLILKKPFDAVEISQLASALTKKWSLARESREHRELLVRTVEERTQELRRSNELLQLEITQRKAAEERLRHDAFHDPLTGLANRALLTDRIDQYLKRAERDPQRGLALLFLDLDNFKLINDSLGHRIGDELLVEFANRLIASLRSVDTVARLNESTAARLGGDEFVILLDAVHTPQDALLVANRIQERLSQPFVLNEREVVVSSSIGIAMRQGATMDASTLLRNADTAMYRAKHAGKARHAMFDESMHKQAMARLEMENAMRVAIEKNEFILHYQPIVALETGQISGFEALVRWKHPSRGIVLPGEFIPVAEETGLILPLGRRVLREACLQLSIWNASRSPEDALSINVNASRRELLEADFCDELARIVQETGIEFHWLNLEVTESTIIGNSRAVEPKLQELKALGVRLHMDDFGTGYSSLSCLQRYPIDQLKIDRAFIIHMEEHRDYTAIVRSIITLARNLNMKVTAEGVETEQQLAQIVTLECDHAQGYFFSKPVNAAAASALIKSHPVWLKLIQQELGLASCSIR